MKNLDKLASISGRSIPAGGSVFEQGDHGSEMFIIHTGTVDIYRRSGSGEEHLASLGPGEFFGEMALVDEGPRSATVRAGGSGDAVLVPIDREFLLRYAEKDAGFIMVILKALSSRLENTNRLLLEKRASMELPPMTSDQLAGHQEPKSAAFLKSFRDNAQAAELLQVARGDVVFRQGETGDRMFIIIEGQVRISQQDGGNMFALAEMGRGDFFGEMALLSGHRRSATATAISPAVLMPVDGEVFRGRARQQPEVALHLIQILILRLRHSLQALS